LSKRFRLSLLTFLLSGVASPLCGQTQNPPPSAPNPPVIRSVTRLVQINVVVRDKKGEPVEDLKQEDFSILDQGQPQQVALFSTQTATPRDHVQLAALPPHVFSNRLDQGGQPPGSVTVILFDALNTSILDQAYARQQVIKFLKQLQPEDHVAIYVLTTQIKVLNEFTHDATSLLQAIERFSGSYSPQLEAANPEPIADSTAFTTTLIGQNPLQNAMESTIASQLKEFLDGASGRISDFANINRAETTLDAIEAIANHVAPIPGRKSLVWVSGSFPVNIGYDEDTIMQANREHRNFGEDIDRAARALNHANMAIYPVDARGLMAPQLYNAGNSTRYNPRAPAQLRGLTSDQKEFDTMILLADRTGGKAFYNTNDIEGAVRRALDDGQFTYTLGFYPTHGKWDGKFHQLKVQVKEKGLTLRYRKGYFAKADPADGSPESKTLLEDAVRSPVEWTNLELQAAVGAFEPSSRNLALQVGLNTRELGFEQKEGRWKDKIYVIFAQLGKGNKPLGSEQQTFDLNLKPETYERFLQIGTKFSGKLALVPEIEALRIVAEDASSSATGTLTIPLKNLLPAESAPAENPPAAQKPKPPN
jgi:VWFA-related protein